VFLKELLVCLIWKVSTLLNLLYTVSPSIFFTYLPVINHRNFRWLLEKNVTERRRRGLKLPVLFHRGLPRRLRTQARAGAVYSKVLCVGALCSKYTRALTLKKNDQAQYDLGLEQKDFVPVVYSNETSWGQELLKFAPTLLIIGVWLFVMRQMGGAKKQISKISTLSLLQCKCTRKLSVESTGGSLSLLLSLYLHTYRRRYGRCWRRRPRKHFPRREGEAGDRQGRAGDIYM